MKKLFAGLAVFTSLTAFAVTNIQLDALNKEIKTLLAHIQDETTQAEVVFSDIKTDADRTLSFSVSGFLAKEGPNPVSLAINPLSYEYGNGTAPQVQFLGAAVTDLSKLISQEDFNGMVPDLEKTITDIADQFAAELKDALTIEAKVTEKNQDAAGNYENVKGHIALTIDLSKLPADLKPEEVPVTAARVDVDLTFKMGVNLSVQLTMNPNYKGFTEDDKGLKNYLDKLLAQDPKVMSDLKHYIDQVNRFATDIANRK